MAKFMNRNLWEVLLCEVALNSFTYRYLRSR